MLMFDILKKFNLYDDVISSNRYGSGLINRTYLIETNDSKYVLQIIDNTVFKEPHKVVENIKNILDYSSNLIEDHKSPFNIELIETTEDEIFPITDGVYSRCYKLPKNLKIIMKVVNQKMIYEIGKGIGSFHRSMRKFPIHSLNLTLPTLHNTDFLFSQLNKFVYETEIEKAIPLFNEVKFVLDRKKDLNCINDLLKQNKIPYTISHNNIRPNNLLFNENTYKVEALFGFDAIMKGSRLYDFGDAVRYFVATTKEDEGNLSIVNFKLDYYKEFVKGYYSEVKNVITDEEVNYFVDAVKCMTLEYGLLFLNNYFEDKSCIKVEYKEQNLDRARNQFKLVKEIENQYQEMKNIVKEVTQK